MKPELQEAHSIADQAGLKILQKRGVFRVYRNTIPKLTFIGERVNEVATLALVKQAARVE